MIDVYPTDPLFLEELFASLAKKYDVHPTDISKIWLSQFKYLARHIQENPRELSKLQINYLLNLQTQRSKIQEKIGKLLTNSRKYLNENQPREKILRYIQSRKHQLEFLHEEALQMLEWHKSRRIAYEEGNKLNFYEKRLEKFQENIRRLEELRHTFREIETLNRGSGPSPEGDMP